ncbi:Protein O-GlcNAcase [Orchesella cincta]|uniref:protein O-GlcNAcase n=1 Tax=Orchesella cincta TaxID=48709 RepID=A0A1D2N5I2_ORCCI|nr:Protein O-GlcNAcase [Orchesella cincta]
MEPQFLAKTEFICGVVEGFYGRPWTTGQRKDLFTKMKKWGMNSYLYAPKDDYKHRAYWRELYTVEEADHLSSLISAAKDKGLRFIYAISPGLDILYSSTKDVGALKRKLEQVNQLGCDAFAILFDDIDPEMSKADKEMFKSFAHAQVSVTNEVYQHVNAQAFLFCPTQYCATRAVPNVRTSEYLKTIGSKLDPTIDIMWTGPKVISKDLTIESIEEITEAIRRPPVIWDNLHANDYDQKRVFLGPYSGRSPLIISRLRGVLTNPNCEYGANFVAIHTLAQWSHCTEDAKKVIDEAMNPDAKLETENEDGNPGHIPENLAPHVYHPIVALRSAIKEWLEEFKKTKQAWGPIIKPQIISVPVPLIPSVNTCITLTSTTTTTTTSCSVPRTTSIIPSAIPTVPTVNCSASELISIVENSNINFIPTSSTTVMNSLVADNKVICADTVDSVTNTGTSDHANSSDSDITEMPMKPVIPKVDSDTPQASLAGLEPMDCNTATPPNRSPPPVVPSAAANERNVEDVPMGENNERTSEMSSPDEGVESGNTSVSVMNLDSELESGGSSTNQANTPSSSMQVENQLDEDSKPVNTEQALTVEDLQLLCDLFYLPFEHGLQGLQLLHDFQWLKTNSNRVAGITEADKSKPEVAEWYDRAKKFSVMTKNVNKISQKLNNIPNRELLYELYPYIWDLRGVCSLMNSYITWLGFSKGWKEAFMSGDQEPWVIRGGLTAELQRLIPVDRGTDLYLYKAPDIPGSQTYTIRPYRSSDEASVYKICSMTYNDGLSAADEFARIPDLPGEITLGGFLNLCPELCFVVEDNNDMIIGAAVAALNGKEFRRRLKMSWLEMLRKKYPVSIDVDSQLAKDTIASLKSELSEIPEDVLTNHPAELKFIVVAPLVDPSVPKRLVTCILAALRANGIFGCFVEVTKEENYFMDLFKKLGFTELCPNYMGRSY